MSTHARALSERIRELDGEWDFDRMLEAKTAVVGLAGVALAFGVDRKFLAVPMIAAVALLASGLSRGSIFLRSFRTVGFRSREEIDADRFTLKGLRGDFQHLPEVGAKQRAAAVWDAVRAR